MVKNPADNAGDKGIWGRGASQLVLELKTLPAKAGDARDTGLIPGWRDPLEKEMATYSSILAWEIPWTAEPGGLQSMGLESVGHDLGTKPQQQQVEYTVWIVSKYLLLLFLSCGNKYNGQ